ncbi:MAG: hypothetical protein SGI74_06080 [Oligoflexia bacterium]|nr:hypothetical protein [Oligoflexia bacterium]
MAPQQYKNLWILIFCISSFLSCSTSLPKFDTRFNQLQAQMPVEKVSQLLGEPDLRELNNGVESWNYNQLDGRYVQFKEGKVTAFGRGVIQAARLATPESSPSLNPTPFVAKGIGLTCSNNLDCQSKNCHFKKCSGPNNCNVDIGNICATNNDCCSGFCDFGFCRKKK